MNWYGWFKVGLFRLWILRRLLYNLLLLQKSNLELQSNVKIKYFQKNLKAFSSLRIFKNTLLLRPLSKSVQPNINRIPINEWNLKLIGPHKITNVWFPSSQKNANITQTMRYIYPIIVIFLNLFCNKNPANEQSKCPKRLKNQTKLCHFSSKNQLST